MDWDPDSTGTIGVQWYPHAEGVVTLDSNLKMAAVSFLQSTSQATGAVQLPVSALPVRGGLYAVEVYDNETGVAANFTVAFAVPNEDVSGTGSGAGQWREDDGTTTTIYTEIDETTLDIADYISNGGGPGTNTLYYGRMNTAAMSLTGKRILSVALHVVGRRAGVDNNTSIVYGLSISGTDHNAPFQVPKYGEQFSLSNTWYYNPQTKKPWTIADVQAFDSTDEWFVGGNSTPDGGVYIFQAYMVVTYVDENRLAVGTLDDTTSALVAGAWNSAALLTPTGGTWTKDGAGRHLYTVRRINSTGQLSVPYLDATPNTCPVASGWTATIDPTYGHITAMGAATTKIMPVLQRTTAPADSVDSLTYADLLVALVHTGQDAEQEYSNSATANYGIVRFVAKPGVGTTADLLVKVKRRSDNVQMGGTLTLTVADVQAETDYGDGWYLVVAQLPSAAALVAATQYYLEFSSTEVAGSTTSWSVAALDTLNSGNTATYGSTTDRATVNGSEADRYDLAATISTIPTAPAGVTAVVGSVGVDATVCSVDTMDIAILDWGATALGASFARYDVQRCENPNDAVPVWFDVASFTSEADPFWARWFDYEAPRGVACAYRVRVVRTDGAVSAWANAAAQVTKPVTDSALYFVSNYDSTFNVVYDTEPDKTYDFPTADELVLTAIYGRDQRLAFGPTENRGVSAIYLVVVALKGINTGVAVFGPLRDIAHAPLPYVCVLDYHGNRQYAALYVPRGEEAQPSRRYVAEVACHDVIDVPYVVEVTS